MNIDEWNAQAFEWARRKKEAEFDERLQLHRRTHKRHQPDMPTLWGPDGRMVSE
jgi:hypothetical protein